MSSFKKTSWDFKDSNLNWVVVLGFPMADDSKATDEMRDPFRKGPKRIRGKEIEDFCMITATRLGSLETSVFICACRLDKEGEHLTLGLMLLSHDDKLAEIRMPASALEDNSAPVMAEFRCHDGIAIGHLRDQKSIKAVKMPRSTK
jgi:hypothetical protein